MGNKLEVYPGMVVGGWEIKQEVEARSNQRRVIALCPNCKREKEMYLACLTRRRPTHPCRSCAIAEINRKCKVKHGSLRDGVEAYKDYHILGNIINRCHNPKNKDYHSYGARGIQVEAPWYVDGHINYPAFHEWYVAEEEKARQIYDEKYWDKFQVDRVDNDGNYSPDNCRLTTSKVQLNNTRLTKYIDGVPMRFWYDEHKTENTVCYATFSSRVLRDHWNPLDAIEKPKGWRETLNLSEYFRTHEHADMDVIVFITRVNRYGWDLERAISTPVTPRQRNKYQKKRKGVEP